MIQFHLTGWKMVIYSLQLTYVCSSIYASGKSDKHNSEMVLHEMAGGVINLCSYLFWWIQQNSFEFNNMGPDYTLSKYTCV